jgi:hypothetical protein
MVIIGDISFPPDATEKVGKNFLALAPVPDYMTLKGPYIRDVKENGIQAVEIYEFDKSKMTEGIAFVTHRHTPSFDTPKYQYKIRVYFEAADVINMVSED